jgi:chorismate-pyruvate lyase
MKTADSRVSPSAETARREPWRDPQASPEETGWAAHLLPILLAQTGSTTRICERIAGGPVQLQLVHQEWLGEAPPAVAGLLGAGRCIERVTSICSHGLVMMDNLAYIGAGGLGEEVLRGLQDGTTPIGHLVENAFVRRAPAPGGEALYPRLWQFAGVPDPTASRAYLLEVVGGPRMLIAECYRRGMLRRT